MDGGLLAEGGFELIGWKLGDERGVEMAESLLQLERPEEGGRHGHLLVEREPDEECERVFCEELIGLGGSGEVDRSWFGHGLDATCASPGGDDSRGSS